MTRAVGRVMPLDVVAQRAAVVLALTLLGACGGPPPPTSAERPAEEALVTATPADPVPTPSPGATTATSSEEEPLPPPESRPVIVAAGLPGDGFVEIAPDGRYQCVHWFWQGPDGSAVPAGVSVRVSDVVVDPPAFPLVPGGCAGDAQSCEGATITEGAPGCDVSVGPPTDPSVEWASVGLRGTVHCDHPAGAACRSVQALVADGEPAALRVHRPPPPGTDPDDDPHDDPPVDPPVDPPADDPPTDDPTADPTEPADAPAGDPSVGTGPGPDVTDGVSDLGPGSGLPRPGDR